jgi:hypothetical protein
VFLYVKGRRYNGRRSNEKVKEGVKERKKICKIR